MCVTETDFIWRKLPKLSDDPIIKDLMRYHDRNIKGVYIIKTDFRHGRVKGECDILYIGQGWLDERLICFTDLSEEHKGWRHTARKRFKGYIEQFPRAEVKFGYKTCRTPEEAKELEKKLISECVTNHLEAPPFNHQS
ncbi:MAG: hypothetical protein NT130_04560 [Candidatus Micrarchaeota archaeon]|nr:hypothetical protein [Candidatus Micrarchaeota archaeon]